MKFKYTCLDLYAITNPAFGALVLREFVKSYTTASDDHVNFSMLYLVLPLLFSVSRIETLKPTNAKTGLSGWLEKSPEIRVRLAEDIKASIPYTQEALLFAIRYKLIRLDNSKFLAVDKAPWKKTPWKSVDDEGKILSGARKIGNWFGQTNNSVTIYHALGIKP